MNEIFIIIGLILLNGALALAEIALVSARKSRLQSEARHGSRSAQKALDLAENPSRFLSTVQIGITLIGILTGIYSGNQIAQDFSLWLERIGMPASYAGPVGQGMIVVMVTYFTLVFGELLPKQIGMNMAERSAKLMSRPMHWLSVAATPFVWILSQSTNAMFRLLGIQENDSKVTEDEIKSIIQEGTEDGEVQPMEQDIMERVFLVGDLTIGSIMTHRNDLVWLDIRSSLENTRAVLEKDLYDAYPVAENDLDHIKGMVSLKDLYLAMHRPNFSLSSIVKEATYYYENMSVYKVLEMMKREGVSRGLVCDEFGSCVGIVTLKDMMEALLGSFADTANPEIIRREGQAEWLVDGKCPIHDLLQYFDKEELYEPDDFTTVAGLCLDRLDCIPKTGDTFEWHTFRFEILDMDGIRIDKVAVRLLPDAPDSGE